jgi:hypothetical protein
MHIKNIQKQLEKKAFPIALVAYRLLIPELVQDV